MMKYAILIAAVILLISQKARKKLIALLLAALVAGGLIAAAALDDRMNEVASQAGTIFGSIDLRDDNKAYYDQFITPHDKKIHTSLILGLDASGKRADIILLAVATDTEISILSIPRDTIVKISPFTEDTCKLSEVMALTGESPPELGLVHALNLNFGLEVSAITELRFAAIPEGIKQLFDDSVCVEMSEIEVAGLNQCAEDCYKRCAEGYLKDYCILDENGEIAFREELAWLCDPANFAAEIRDGVPVEKDGTPAKARNEQLYKINDLLSEYHGDFEPLSDEKKPYYLNGRQFLACLRKRHCYANQAQTRTETAALLLTDLVPLFIQKSTADENYAKKVEAFCTYCSENGLMRTSYGSLDEIKAAFLSPLRPITNGIVRDGKRCTTLPYWDMNYGDVLIGNYVSPRDMTAYLLYDEDGREGE